MKYIFHHGSHPNLSHLEIATVLQREFPQKHQFITTTKSYSIIELEEEISQNFINTLGGTERISLVLAEKPEMFKENDLIKYLPENPDKKIKVGFSAYESNSYNMKKLGINLKRLARENNIRINFITPQKASNRLNAAQVIYNQLDESPNREFNFIETANNHILTQTKQIQDIESYEIRDTSRPARDTKIGMLPPKLAQIMINLIPNLSLEKPVIYDPFCGMGTILQEAWLKNFFAIGSDSNPEMIKASRKNLNWIKNKFHINEEIKPETFLHNINRELPPDLTSQPVDAVVTEPYLGHSLNHPLARKNITKRHNKLYPLYLRFFQNIHPALVENGWVVTIFPAIATKDTQQKEFITFPNSIVDEIESMGYIIKHLGHNNRGLIYARKNTHVAREITLWQKTN